MAGKKGDKFVWILISISIIILFFHYPLMYLNQAGIEDDITFSLLTGHTTDEPSGDLYYMVKDILSVYEKPGLFLKDMVTFEYNGEIIPLQGSLPFLFHAFLYLITRNLTLAILLGSAISYMLIIYLLLCIAELFWGKKAGERKLMTSLLVSVFLAFPYSILSIVRYFNMHLFDKAYSFTPYISGHIGRFIFANHIIIFLLLWFYTLVRALEGKSKTDYILLGITLALIQYTYFYYFTGALLMTGIVLLIRNGFSIESVKNGAVAYGTWALLSLPYLLNFVIYKDVNNEAMMMAGPLFLSNDYFPDFRILIMFLIMAVVIFMAIEYCHLRKKGINDYKVLIKKSSIPIGLLVSTVLLLNIQYVLGYTIQPSHWIVSFALPLFLIIMIVQIPKLIKLFNKSFEQTIKPVIGACIAVLVLGVVLSNVASAQHWGENFYLTPEEKELFDWIKKSTDKDDVFYAPEPVLNDIIVMHTGRNQLLGYNVHSRVSVKEVHERLYFACENDITCELPDLLQEEQLAAHQRYYHGYGDSATFGGAMIIPPDKSKKPENPIKAELSALISKGSDMPFRLDYLLYRAGYWDGNLDNVVFSNNAFIVTSVPQDLN
ncbi:hypothetical protein ACFL1B_02480 [Nanoarchaeota archaeon]